MQLGGVCRIEGTKNIDREAGTLTMVDGVKEVKRLSLFNDF